MIIGFCIPLHQDFPNPELLALHHANFDIDRVALNPRFDRDRLERKVTVVLVQGTQIHSFGIHIDPCFQSFQIVNLSTLDAQDGVQLSAPIFRIPRESDFTKMKLVSFTDVKLDTDQPLRQPVNRVSQNARIAVAFFVVER